MDTINEGDTSQPLEITFPSVPTSLTITVSDADGTVLRQQAGVAPSGGLTHLLYLDPADVAITTAARQATRIVTVRATYSDGRQGTLEHVISVRNLIGI